jgi:hypothetical protein
MSDDQFEDFLRRAARDYRHPPETPREEMWARIAARRAQRQAAQAARPSAGVLWARWGLAAAAVLAVGIGIGLTIGHRTGAPEITPTRRPLAVVPGTSSPQLPAAFAIAAYDHLRRVETFLEVFQAEARTRVPPEAADVARGLLENTRLLIDSPVGREQRFAVLLDDVEVVLAQIASYGGSRDTSDLQLIEQGIEQRGLLAKLRAAAPATYQVARAQGVL